jgi:hypothetical protein
MTIELFFKKTSRLFLFLFLVGFLFFYLFLSWNNRLSHDDFYSLYAVKKQGILEGVRNQFYNWCPRSFSVLLSFCIVVLTQQFSFALFVWQLVLLIVSVFSFKKLLCVLLNRNWIRLETGGPWFGAVLITSGFFFCVSDIGQTWFWTASSTTYLLSFLLLVYGISILLNEKISVLLQVELFIIFLVVGNSSEPQAVLVLLVLIGLLIFSLGFTSEKKSIIPANKISIALFGLLVGWCWVMFAPGTAARASVFPEISFLSAFLLNYKLLAILFLQKISWKFLLIVCFGFSIGSVIRPAQIIGKRKLIFVLLLSAACIEIFQLIITRATADLSAERVYLPVVAFILISAVFVGWKFLSTRLLSIFIAVVFFYVIGNGIFLFTATRNYVTAYDERLETLRKDADTSVLFVKPLPHSGFLFSAELSSDSNAFANQHLRMAFGRKFPIVLKSE